MNMLDPTPLPLSLLLPLAAAASITLVSIHSWQIYDAGSKVQHFF